MTLTIPAEVRFPLGECFATANALAHFAANLLLEHLGRHARGDWGSLEEEDALSNEKALETEQGRIVSRYLFPGGKKLWIITEADRSATTMMLPEDY